MAIEGISGGRRLWSLGTSRALLEYCAKKLPSKLFAFVQLVLSVIYGFTQGVVPGELIRRTATVEMQKKAYLKKGGRPKWWITVYRRNAFLKDLSDA
jgi:hypothetical protein